MNDNNTSNYPKPDKKPLMNLSSAADYLCIHKTTLARKAKAKEVAHYRVGVRILFDQAGLDEYLERCKVKAE